MTAKEAFYKVTNMLSGMRATSCYEYDSVFVFQMAPESVKDPSRLLTGLTCVDKKSGTVRTFRPLDMPIDEYSRGKKVPADIYGGA